MAGAHNSTWSLDSTFHVYSLRDRGVSQGFIIVEFHKPIADEEKPEVAEAVDNLAAVLALYLSFGSRPVGSVMRIIESEHGNTQNNSGHLTQRQLAILRGMVDGKTNNDLANSLGFSVSTIRHETMRIYQVLCVSDRHEAATKALSMGLI